jgi:hypothetical protein
MAGSTAVPIVSPWPYFAEQIIPRLTSDDDSALWQVVVEPVIGDAELACQHYRGKARIIAEIGRCSHWIAPNKARWITSDGEFTWPSGYQPKAGFFGGLPEFDWHLFWERDDKEGTWRHTPKVRAKRPLLRRVAIPARTALHLRASLQAIWAPGPRPELNPSRLFYGFRKLDSIWQCRAYRGLKGKGRA